MTARQVIEADLTWTGAALEQGVRVAVGADGRIEAVGATAEPTTLRLADRALLPGMINAHSHAFQRALRGRGETFGEGAGSFWSWREAMYGLVAGMDAAALHDICVGAFREMLAAGMTTVGEFHYLHHDESERGFAFDEVVLGAARETGIRIVLLEAYYATGDIGVPLARPQRRFRCAAPGAYWEQMDHLAGRLAPGQTLGVVAHSIRAVPADDLVALHEESRRRGLVFHMHVEEQPREIESCLRHHQCTPMALLNERLAIDPRFTAVHCTHTAEADLDRFLQAGGNVCICPLTEANLGDGLADVPYIARHQGSMCLGSDSNARISMLEEMRWLEYGQRLRTQSRGVCVDGDGENASALFRCATEGGARSLGLQAGMIKPGYLADFATVDLSHPQLAGWTPPSLLAALVFGAGDGVIGEVCVGGQWQAGSAP